jgi:hypothetical protein
LPLPLEIKSSSLFCKFPWLSVHLVEPHWIWDRSWLSKWTRPAHQNYCQHKGGVCLILNLPNSLKNNSIILNCNSYWIPSVPRELTELQLLLNSNSPERIDSWGKGGLQFLLLKFDREHTQRTQAAYFSSWECFWYLDGPLGATKRIPYVWADKNSPKANYTPVAPVCGPPETYRF